MRQPVNILVSLVRWLFFAVLVSTAPVLARWWSSGMGTSSSVVESVLGRGELYLIAAALAGEAIGEAILGASRTPLTKILKYACVGGCGIVVYIAAAAYQRVADQLDMFTNYDANSVAWQSIYLFIIALVGACSCVALGCHAK